MGMIKFAPYYKLWNKQWSSLESFIFFSMISAVSVVKCLGHSCEAMLQR